MRLTLPYPPTANLYWRVFRGRPVKSSAARKYQASIGDIVRAQVGPRCRFPVFPKGTEVAVAMVVYRPIRRGDLDNLQKVMLDALRGLAFHDDEQVVRIVADRDDSKQHPRAEVLIEPRVREGQLNAFELLHEPVSPSLGPLLYESPLVSNIELLANIEKASRVTLRTALPEPTWSRLEGGYIDPNPDPLPLTYERQTAVATEKKRPLTTRELAARAKPNVVRSSTRSDEE